jgi:hypothetical protein
MAPAPTRMDWHNFMLGLDRLTAATGRDNSKHYYEIYPERAITTTLATRALMNKEITHYIQQWMACQQLVVTRAVNVVNLARLSGVLYSEEVAATLRYNTFNTLLRSLQGTPMCSWIYDTVFQLAKNFIHVSSEAGVKVFFPYFLNPEDEWFDLPSIFGSDARPIGGVTRRPPTLTEIVDSGEFVASGTWDGVSTHAALTDPQTMFPEDLFSGIPSTYLKVLKYYDTLMDWMLAELAASISDFKTKFGYNANNKLNVIGPTQTTDTVIYWAELGVVSGEFDIANFFNDVNGIDLYDYEALADQPERNMDLKPTPVFRRKPASDETGDHSTLSRWLLRPFTFDSSAESYPGELRIAFDLDDDQYWLQVRGECMTSGFITSLPEEFPYAAIVASDADEHNDMLNKSELPSSTDNLLGTTDPGSADKGGLMTTIGHQQLRRYSAGNYVYVSSEDKGLIASAINGDQNVYISRAMLEDGGFMPMYKKYPVFNPTDIFQHGEFLILSIGDDNEYAKLGSWELGLSAIGCYNSDAAWAYGSKQSYRGLVADTDTVVPTDDVLWSVDAVRKAIGLALVFIGDAARLTPAIHFRRKDIAFCSSVSGEDMYSKGAVCLIPIKPHSNYQFIQDVSFDESNLSLEGVTVSSGVYAIDTTDGDFGLMDVAYMDVNRQTLAEQFFLPGMIPSLFAPIKEETLYAIRALETHADRAHHDLGAVLSPNVFSWNSKAPETSLTIQKGMLVMRRSRDGKASRGDDRRDSRRNEGRRDSRSSSDYRGRTSRDNRRRRPKPYSKETEETGKESFNPESAYSDKSAVDGASRASKSGKDDDYRTGK